MAAEAVSLLGFDYLMFDMQHGLVTAQELVPLLQAAHATKRKIVRVPSGDPAIIGWCLDVGATSVVVPMVNSAAEAASAVAACRYPPVGTRSTGPTRAKLVYGADYLSKSSEFVQCIPMIETPSALDCLDSILDVPGVDVIYVGPSDLSVGLGLGPGNNDGELAFDNALDQIVDACHRHNVVAGIHADARLASRRLDQGFEMVTIAEDLEVLQLSLAEILDQIRN